MNKYILLLALVVIGCQQKRTDQPEAKYTTFERTEKVNKQANKPEVAQDVNILNLLDELTNSCGYLALPFVYDYTSGPSSKIICKEAIGEQKYDLIRQHLGCDVIYGVLPETKNYSAVLVGLAASMMSIELMTIDSVGGLINRKPIMHNNCIHYVEEDLYCHENVILSDSLTISYSYESKYIIYDLEENADTVCDVIYQSGRLKSDGKIELEELIERTCD